jgi:phosphatidate cytidylyltransferase
VPIPTLTLFLGCSLAVVALGSFAAAPRGGRFRGLPGWAGFWTFLAPLLVVLARGPRAVAFLLLGLLMFAALREYFFLAPLRPRDRWAILAAYLAIPLTLWPAWADAPGLYLSVVPLGLFVFFPLIVALRSPAAGWFESLGRLLVGITAFEYAAGHLGLMGPTFGAGRLEFFGVLVLAAEFPQRLAGRLRPGEVPWRPVTGWVAGSALAAAAGAFLGPLCGLSGREGALAGWILATGAAAGAMVAEAVAQDLNLGAPASRLGRGAFLDRALPAVFAAPVFFHFVRLSAGTP